MGDVDKGRIFRIAPPGAKYAMPKVDVSTVEGAIAALQSPNQDARYLAWTALHDFGTKAEPALAKMFREDPNPRFRARALWLLSKLPGKGADYLKAAADGEPGRPEDRRDPGRSRAVARLAMDAPRRRRGVARGPPRAGDRPGRGSLAGRRLGEARARRIAATIAGTWKPSASPRRSTGMNAWRPT